MREGAIEIADRQAKGLGAYRRVAYTDWGDADNPRVALCVHGMTRNSRDFDFLADALQQTHRVICIDVAGRGKSDPLRDTAGYRIETYISDVRMLLAALKIVEVDWVGTSMGGLMGMAVAGAPDAVMRAMVRRLVLNDIGAVLPGAAMDQIADYVGRVPPLADLDAAAAYQRQLCGAWGALTAEQWLHLGRHSVVRQEDGGFRSHYDPRIGDVLRAALPMADVVTWPLWDNVSCPVLIVRGAESGILLAETAQEMTRRGPTARLVEIDGVGHAPALMDAFQIETIAEFLAG